MIEYSVKTMTKTAWQFSLFFPGALPGGSLSLFLPQAAVVVVAPGLLLPCLRQGRAVRIPLGPKASA